LQGFIGVPDLPPHYLPREADLAELKRKLLASGVNVGITEQTSAVGVQGMGGVGKTVLVTTLAHDPDVRKAFPEGIFWLTVGQKPNLLDLQNRLLRQLTGFSKETLVTEQEANPYSLNLTGKSCALVIDYPQR
jgi:hypothetical protein